jgi:hypothetical protein
MVGGLLAIVQISVANFNSIRNRKAPMYVDQALGHGLLPRDLTLAWSGDYFAFLV